MNFTPRRLRAQLTSARASVAVNFLPRTMELMCCHSVGVSWADIAALSAAEKQATVSRSVTGAAILTSAVLHKQVRGPS